MFFNLFAGKTPTGVPLREEPIAVTADSLLGAGVFLQYNPDDLFKRKGFDIYRKMMVDEQVKAVVRFHRDAVTGRSWKFEDNKLLSEEENEKRRLLLTAIIKRMKGSFKTRLDMIMSSLYNGFSLTEKTFELFEYEGKQWSGIKKLSLKPFDTFYFNMDEFGQLTTLEQNIGGHRAELDITNFIHHVQNADAHEFYGQSELREAHRAWYYKDTTIKLQSLFLERTAAGFVSITPKQGSNLTTKSPEYKGLTEILSNIRGTMGVILPQNVELMVHSPKDTQAFERAIQGHDKAIAKSLLMPNLLGLSEQGPGGSRALGDTQLEAFLWMLDAEAGNLEEVVNEQLFQDLADQNFPDGLYPPWRLLELSNTKTMAIIDQWKGLVSDNAVKSTAQDERHLRALLDFPESEIDETEATIVDPQTALSGTQVASMLSIIEQVGSEKIPRETGIQILLNAFPVNLETAELIMGEVGQGFEPKGAPAQELPLLPGPDEDDPDEDDPDELDDETIIAAGGSQEISADLKRKKLQAENRVAFKVIERKSTDITEEAVVELSNLIMAMVKPVTDELRKVEEFNVDIVKELKFNSKAINKIQKANKRMLTVAWQLGIKHARDEVNKAAGKQMAVSFVRLDQDAAKYFDTKSFTMTGKLTTDMLVITQNIISQSIKKSASAAETVDQIYEAYGTQGFITKEAAEAEMSKLLSTVEGGGAARLHTVVRTNAFEAINEARYSFFTDPDLDNFVEAMEYSAILDDRVTQICEHLDGHEHAAEGEVWGGMWRPPNHFNCRSLLIPITATDKWTEDPEPSLLPQEGFR